ncbi:MAG: hypothetical protein KY451_06275, partial [Actinobacteria bacterium]|nr:hypothetical protein [Actinomycetota bacterium]MBW3646589.1 hypothetical protein [Actinomycetota bacterium]
MASDGTSDPAASGCTFAGASTGVVAPVEPTGGGLPWVDLPGAVDLPLPLPPPQAQLDEARTLAATATLRDALDLGDAASRIEGTSLVLEPIAGALPTSGAATVVQLSEKGRLVSATGWLSTGTQGARYPLRSAQEALDDLPVLALGAPCDAAGCPERAAGPFVTGARLGLSRVALAGPAAALVPSWLFDVEGSAAPLVALAVADRFLGEPDPAGIDPGTRPGAPEPGGVEPGGVGSDPGKPSGPDAGPPTIPEDREMFGFDGAYADPDPMVLVVRYGDSGSCPSQAVQHSVVEEPDRVIVHLSRTPAPTMQACTADYRAVL